MIIKKQRIFLDSHKKLLYIVVFLLALIVALEVLNVTHLFHDKKPESGTIPLVTSGEKGQAQQSQDSSAVGTQQKQDSIPTSSPDESSDINAAAPNLAAPYGSFVSNHRPNLGGVPAPSAEESSCITTPGAQCYIQFTNGGATKTLPTRTAGSDGSVWWRWDIKSAGFTEGNWQITAIASLDGKSKSTTDPQDMVVRP